MKLARSSIHRPFGYSRLRARSSVFLRRQLSARTCCPADLAIAFIYPAVMSPASVILLIIDAGNMTERGEQVMLVLLCTVCYAVENLATTAFAENSFGTVGNGWKTVGRVWLN